jgi:uncharacterized membrane protein YczE
VRPERRGWSRDQAADWFFGRGRWRLSPVVNAVILAAFLALLLSVVFGHQTQLGRWIVIVISVPMIVRSGLQLIDRRPR